MPRGFVSVHLTGPGHSVRNGKAFAILNAKVVTAPSIMTVMYVSLTRSKHLTQISSYASAALSSLERLARLRSCPVIFHAVVMTTVTHILTQLYVLLAQKVMHW